jgi:hypothetical protein
MTILHHTLVILTEKLLKRKCVDRKEFEEGRSKYRNIDYVINECKSIVNQIRGEK